MRIVLLSLDCRLILSMMLECADLVKWEEADDDRADNTAVGDGPKPIARVPRIRSFAVVTRNKELTIWDCDVYFARCVLFGAVSIGSAPFIIIDKAVWVFGVVYGHGAIFYSDAFAGEGNNTFNNILIADIGGQIASHRMLYSLSLVFGNFSLVFVHEDDNLAAFGDIFLTNKMCPRHCGTIDYDAVIAM